MGSIFKRFLVIFGPKWRYPFGGGKSQKSEKSEHSESEEDEDEDGKTELIEMGLKDELEDELKIIDIDPNCELKYVYGCFMSCEKGKKFRFFLIFLTLI